jgi:N-acetylglutamate synthase-like GNAT family acetyltransferase
MSGDYELVSPADSASWRAFHDIRREVLFEARGRYDVYNESHPDDVVLGHHPKLLLHRGDPVGVIRIDISGHEAILRRVAIRSEVQRSGHGRTLVSLAEAFAVSQGCGRVASHVARDAVGFYEKCGFSRADADEAPSEGSSVLMTKVL